MPSSTIGLVQSCSLILRLGSSPGTGRCTPYMLLPARLLDSPDTEAWPEVEPPALLVDEEEAEDEAPGDALPPLPAAGASVARSIANTRAAVLTMASAYR